MILEDLQPAFLPQVYLVLLSVQSEVGGLPISSAASLALSLAAVRKLHMGAQQPIPPIYCIDNSVLRLNGVVVLMLVVSNSGLSPVLYHRATSASLVHF